jgi:hypothetical protein
MTLTLESYSADLVSFSTPRERVPDEEACVRKLWTESSVLYSESVPKQFAICAGHRSTRSCMQIK